MIFADVYILHGEQIESLTMAMFGHDVQILRYDGDNNHVVVAVDNAVAQMAMSEIDSFIWSRI